MHSLSGLQLKTLDFAKSNIIKNNEKNLRDCWYHAVQKIGHEDVIVVVSVTDQNLEVLFNDRATFVNNIRPLNIKNINIKIEESASKRTDPIGVKKFWVLVVDQNLKVIEQTKMIDFAWLCNGGTC